jgi:SAM-dependent methyltransferase
MLLMTNATRMAFNSESGEREGSATITGDANGRDDHPRGRAAHPGVLLQVFARGTWRHVAVASNGTPPSPRNVDAETVRGFGAEWSRFNFVGRPAKELDEAFADYFSLFPWNELPPGAEGFDAGCGSGRWAARVARRVGKLHCVDASADALAVARTNLAGAPNCEFHHVELDAMPVPERSMDFGYSLGVLHHLPDTSSGLAACVSKLKPGAPFLVYLYYALDNRPAFYRSMWKASDLVRRRVATLPFNVRLAVSQAIAIAVYWPLARAARSLERLGIAATNVPLYQYRNQTFYVMQNDALDRFGTRLEHRFSRAQIQAMMEAAGLERIVFRDGSPYWCALGYRS